MKEKKLYKSVYIQECEYLLQLIKKLLKKFLFLHQVNLRRELRAAHLIRV